MGSASVYSMGWPSKAITVGFGLKGSSKYVGGSHVQLYPHSTDRHTIRSNSFLQPCHQNMIPSHRSNHNRYAAVWVGGGKGLPHEVPIKVCQQRRSI